MPATFTRTFRVRHYECDAYGHANNANYLRWMQETAFDASAAVGFDFSRYDEMGYLWLIRETDIEYLSPLRYGDLVDIKTYVIDFRRFRSRRAYEFYRHDSGEPVARASTDWIYLNTESLRPTRVPQEMIDGFFPEGAPNEAPPRERFPEPPPPPSGAYTMRRMVEWRDIDQMWHVNNANYLAYMEDVAIRMCDHFGWPMDRMRDEGFGIIARRHRIEYVQQAAMGDELEVSTWFSDRRNASVNRHYTIHRVGDNALVSRARTRWVWADIETGRPIKIPPHFIADFAANEAKEAK